MSGWFPAEPDSVSPSSGSITHEKSNPKPLGRPAIERPSSCLKKSKGCLRVVSRAVGKVNPQEESPQGGGRWDGCASACRKTNSGPSRKAQAGVGHLFFVDAAHFVFGTFLCCLWSFTSETRSCKRRAIYGRYHPTFADFRAAVEETIAQLPTIHASRLASLMTLNFQRSRRAAAKKSRHRNAGTKHKCLHILYLQQVSSRGSCAARGASAPPSSPVGRWHWRSALRL